MDRFTGQIMPVAFTFAPKGTAFTQGTQLPINQNAALFSLLGLTYGGNGATNFGLPDTRGRTVIGFGTSQSAGTIAIGAKGGEVAHALQIGEMPAHTHTLAAATSGTTDPVPSDRLPGVAIAGAPAYGAPDALVVLGGAPSSTGGGGLPHSNVQPSLAINYVIVLNGIFPSRN